MTAPDSTIRTAAEALEAAAEVCVTWCYGEESQDPFAIADAIRALASRIPAGPPDTQSGYNNYEIAAGVVVGVTLGLLTAATLELAGVLK